ncbi:MAG: choice-of-anchor B family protein [Bacteroidota bacterium]|nr:choice-of-anchor B family protein [Bacteroidota bacterium]
MKNLLFATAALFSFGQATAQLNVTLQGQLAYPGQTCANICGYVDSLGNEYALVGASLGMSIVDVTNPAAPVEVIQIPGPDNLWKEIKVRGKYAYVTTEAGGGLQIINLSSLPNTAGIVYQNWTGDGAIAGMLNTIHALHIDNNFVYLYGTNLFGGGAVVADLTDPWNPVYVGKYTNSVSDYVHDGYVRNDTMYSGHINGGFFSVVDFTNKSAPVELANQITPNAFTHNTWLSQNSKVLFTTDEKDNSFLAAYDISNLSGINELDRIQSNPGSMSVVHNTHIINVLGNDYAVTSWYKDGFTITDVGRPVNMIQVGDYDTYAGSGGGFEGAWGVYPYLPSGTIVVSNIDEGLFVFSPTYVRACYLEGIVSDSTCTALLQNVNVQVSALGLNESTDIVGQYRTGSPAAGTYNVTFSKSGYITKTVTGVVFSPGVVTVLDVALVANNTVNVSGSVSDVVTTNPLSGANVSISNATNSYGFSTDALGQFSSCNVVGANNYDINVAKWGYESLCLTNQDLTAINNILNYPLAKEYYDDFALNQGWMSSGSSSTGQWVRDFPVGTMLGGDQANPGADVMTDCSGMAYVTGNGGGAGGDFDVDGGSAYLKSPIFDLTGYTDPYLDYDRWFYTGGGAGSPNDSLSVTLNNGITSVMLEFARDTTAGNSTWLHKSYRVIDKITPTANMQLIVRTADISPGHIVEAGFDRFLINEGTTSVAENSISEISMNVYPNPFSNETTVAYDMKNRSMNGANMVITDITGRIIESLPLTMTNGEVKINPSVQAGIYFVRILNNEGGNVPVKILKLK